MNLCNAPKMPVVFVVSITTKNFKINWLGFHRSLLNTTKIFQETFTGCKVSGKYYLSYLRDNVIKTNKRRCGCHLARMQTWHQNAMWPAHHLVFDKHHQVWGNRPSRRRVCSMEVVSHKKLTKLLVWSHNTAVLPEFCFPLWGIIHAHCISNIAVI